VAITLHAISIVVPTQVFAVCLILVAYVWGQDGICPNAAILRCPLLVSLDLPRHQSRYSLVLSDVIQKAAARRIYTIADMRHYMTACTQVWTGSQEPWAWFQVQQHWKPAGTAVVHITGTKGKGSTACMVERMLRDQNKRTPFGGYSRKDSHQRIARSKARINDG
jgi:hypothetical protein